LEKSLKDLDDKITEEQKNEIKEGIENLKSSISKREIESIQKNLDEVNLKFQKISQDLYNQTTTDSDNGFTGSDVEFEEVTNN
jgi:molecular chaperone DnaK